MSLSRYTHVLFFLTLPPQELPSPKGVQDYVSQNRQEVHFTAIITHEKDENVKNKMKEPLLFEAGGITQKFAGYSEVKIIDDYAKKPSEPNAHAKIHEWVELFDDSSLSEDEITSAVKPRRN